MAKNDKTGKKGGGCLLQGLLGLLAGIAALLALLFFLSSGPRDGEEGYSTADEAAASAMAAEPAAPVALPPVVAPAETAPVPHPVDAGLDPVSDDQIADDAAAAGMTSRPPSKAGE